MSSVSSKQIVGATKWSAITEVISKLITPITSMVLARLLTPEAFGVVATITMVITFAEIFTDAGFQKYLIQHDFRDANDRKQSTDVAFWSNFIVSMIIWGIIVLFCEPIATLVGNSGLGCVIAFACVSIPLAAFSSIQMALYKRDLDFKTLFKVRIVAICIPLFVTIPCALIFRNYWALIIGIIARDLANAILLTWYSTWKPRFFYSFEKLKEMLSFTIWSLIEAISIWLTTYVDVFLVGTLLSQYHLGLYKTSTTLVGQIMHLITAATTPVLFSSLSRLQHDEEEFKTLFFNFQKIVGMLVLPLGVGVYCYSDFITNVMLGEKWTEITNFLGLWGLTSAIMIVLAHYSSEVYRSKGKPKLSVLAQWLHIIVLWPTVLIAIQYGFEVLCTARALVRLEGIAVNLALMGIVLHFSPSKMILNVVPICCASLIIFPVSYISRNIFPDGFLYSMLGILICTIAYIMVVAIFPKERSILLQTYRNAKNKVNRKNNNINNL